MLVGAGKRPKKVKDGQGVEGVGSDIGREMKKKQMNWIAQERR